MGPVTIFDSTLRDGAQGTGVAFSLEDKLQAVRLLEGQFKEVGEELLAEMEQASLVNVL